MKASSTLDAWPAAISARATVGRPTASSLEIADVGELRVDRQVELAQEGDRALEPFAPPGALCGEGRLERLVVWIHPETEDVQLAFPQPEVPGDDRVDLDTGDEGQSGGDRGVGDDLAVARERVVVGQREEADAHLERGPDECGRLHDAVGTSRVRVQVDRRGTRRLDPAVARRGERIVATTPGRGGHLTPRRAAGCARWRGRDRSPGRCRPGAR